MYTYLYHLFNIYVVHTLFAYNRKTSSSHSKKLETRNWFNRSYSFIKTSGRNIFHELFAFNASVCPLYIHEAAELLIVSSVKSVSGQFLQITWVIMIQENMEEIHDCMFPVQNQSVFLIFQHVLFFHGQYFLHNRLTKTNIQFFSMHYDFASIISDAKIAYVYFICFQVSLRVQNGRYARLWNIYVYFYIITMRYGILMSLLWRF